MFFSKQLRRVRRARKFAGAQQNTLLEIELEGIVAITLHTVTQSLTVATDREAGVQVIDMLGQALRERRQLLQREVRDLLESWQENEVLRGRKASLNPPPAASLPVATMDA